MDRHGHVSIFRFDNISCTSIPYLSLVKSVLRRSSIEVCEEGDNMDRGLSMACEPSRFWFMMFALDYFVLRYTVFIFVESIVYKYVGIANIEKLSSCVHRQILIDTFSVEVYIVTRFRLMLFEKIENSKILQVPQYLCLYV